MIYPVSLQTAGIASGLLLLVAHGIALAAPQPTRRFLAAFPRSEAIGTALIAIAGIWTFLLVQAMDLGEFGNLKRPLLIAVPIGAVLTWKFVDEFLAVRALGILLLLAATPLLEAAFLKEPVSRLLLVILAYYWIIAGLFLVGVPYVLRDVITWLLARPRIFNVTAIIGLAYGTAILACAFLFWK
jgi:hypothetical protein